MKPATPRTLEQMQHYATRYEVAIEIDGESTVVGYTVRKTRGMLVMYAQDYMDRLLTALGDDADNPVKYTKSSLQFSATVRVYYTGRTERDARVALNGNV